jgi:predicted unusual protein kinase regulating ubiquinone biosynthesis (AarF/ABC1/UbiB family)
MGAIRRGVKLAKAANLARRASRATTEQERRAARAALCRLLGEARGMPMKIGQLFASEDDDDPMRPLLLGVDPMDFEGIQEVVEGELEGPLRATFSEFSEKARAASLGQVHEARLLDGREVAVKVQYPGIVDAVQSELKLLGFLPNGGPGRRWGFDLDAYRQVLADNMTEELDYTREAERQELFAELVQVRGLVVPAVHPGLCRTRVLVQQFVDGSPFCEAKTWSKTAPFRASHSG